MTSKTFWLGAAAIAALSLWLRTGFPVSGLGEAAYDDMLFIKLAGYLGSGRWLGPYNELTLAKGVFYPLFILIAFASAIPLKIAEQIVYLAASALTARFIARQDSERLALILFAALAFNPVLWSASLARVIREGLYLSLCLAVATLMLAVAFPPRQATGRKRIWGLGAALGLTAASFWLTREEGYWLLPTLVLPVAMMILQLRQPRPISARLRPLVVALAAFAATLTLVATTNAAQYGVFRLTDFQSGNFIKSYGAISRIKPDSWHRYVVFPQDARQGAYAASPAARELQPYLDGELGRDWRDAGCNETGTKDCPEILSGWFMWALRGAAAKAGHHTSAVEADTFYKRLADEINAACDTGKLACLPPRSTMLPPFRWIYLTDALTPALRIADRLFHIGNGSIGSPPSQGEDSMVRNFARLTGGVVPKPSSPTIVIRGWAGSTLAIPKFTIAGSGEQGSRTTVEILNPQAAPPPGDLKTALFVITTDCPADQCSLVVSDGTDETRLPLNALSTPRVTRLPLQVQLDNPAAGRLRDKAADPVLLRQAVQVRIAAGIAHFYRVAIPVLSVLGLFGIGTAILLGRRYPPCWPLLAAALTSLAAVLSRIALLSFMDISSIPGTGLLYASPASPFVIVFAITGSCLALSTARKEYARRRAQPASSLPPLPTA